MIFVFRKWIENKMLAIILFHVHTMLILMEILRKFDANVATNFTDRRCRRSEGGLDRGEKDNLIPTATQVT